MTRRLYLSLFLGVAFSPALLPEQQNQNQQANQPQKKQPQQNQPSEEDEQNPPEEDESVAPEKFVLDPLESERNVKVGNFYMHKGSASGYRAALARYERAAKFNPQNAEAYFKMGEAEEKLKNKDKAKIAFERVVQIEPDSKLGREAKKKLSKI